jgi:hypothetical protein
MRFARMRKDHIENLNEYIRDAGSNTKIIKMGK